MKKSNFFLWVIILAFFICSDCLATNYFISNSGNDNNNGTSISTPWKTLMKINNTLFHHGDTIKLKGGEIFESSSSLYGSKLWISSSGSVDSPIVYTSYGDNRAIIKADTIGIYCVNKEYIEIRSINLRSSFNPFNQTGLSIFNNFGIYFLNIGNTKLNKLKIDSCGISRFLDGGIHFNSDCIPGYEDIKITNCRIDSIGQHGYCFNRYHLMKRLFNWQNYRQSRPERFCDEMI